MRRWTPDSIDLPLTLGSMLYSDKTFPLKLLTPEALQQNRSAPVFESVPTSGNFSASMGGGIHGPDAHLSPEQRLRRKALRLEKIMREQAEAKEMEAKVAEAAAVGAAAAKAEKAKAKAAKAEKAKAAAAKGEKAEAAEARMDKARAEKAKVAAAKLASPFHLPGGDMGVAQIDALNESMLVQSKVTPQAKPLVTARSWSEANHSLRVRRHAQGRTIKQPPPLSSRAEKKAERDKAEAAQMKVVAHKAPKGTSPTPISQPKLVMPKPDTPPLDTTPLDTRTPTSLKLEKPQPDLPPPDTPLPDTPPLEKPLPDTPLTDTPPLEKPRPNTPPLEKLLPDTQPPTSPKLGTQQGKPPIHTESSQPVSVLALSNPKPPSRLAFLFLSRSWFACPRFPALAAVLRLPLFCRASVVLLADHADLRRANWCRGRRRPSFVHPGRLRSRRPYTLECRRGRKPLRGSEQPAGRGRAGRRHAADQEGEAVEG